GGGGALSAPSPPPPPSPPRLSCPSRLIMGGMALSSLLEEALEAWQYTRHGVIEEIENLSEADLNFRPHAESRTVAEIGLHIVESGLMMAGELTRPDGHFRRQS